MALKTYKPSLLPYRKAYLKFGTLPPGSPHWYIFYGGPLPIQGQCSDAVIYCTWLIYRVLELIYTTATLLLTGYKLCLRINLNGIDSGAHTHVSMFVHLMQGEFDSIVQWPFPGSIVLTIMDQDAQGEPQHVRETLNARPSLQVSSSFSMMLWVSPPDTALLPK